MVDGICPAFVEFDTGADLHAHLVDRGYSLAKLPDALFGDVQHFHGVTRAKLGGLLRRYATHLGLVSKKSETQLTAAAPIAMQRLKEIYGLNASDATLKLKPPRHN